MINIDTSAVLLGFAVGVPMSLLFFWGLNWGMQVALVSPHPGRLLMLSFFVRLVLLLAVGFGLTALNGTLWALAGYMIAYIIVRVVTVMRAELKPRATVSKQEGV